jgi:outer membrane protein assembly factor BamB
VPGDQADRRKGQCAVAVRGGVSVEGDRVYATTGVGDAAALDVANGAIVWKKRPGGPLRGSPTVSNGNVYVVSQDNQLFALNAATVTRSGTSRGRWRRRRVRGRGTGRGPGHGDRGLLRPAN